MPLRPDYLSAAIASAPSSSRPHFEAVFDFDQRLANIVASASDPLLGQIQLAWWRENLSRSGLGAKGIPPELQQLSLAFGKAAANFGCLVDGWEQLLAHETIDRSAIEQFAEARGRAVSEIARAVSSRDCSERAFHAGKRWALVDLAQNTDSEEIRTRAIGAARQVSSYGIISAREMRPLAILDGLAKRALRKNLPALFGDRMSPMVLLRLGLLGR